jgi:predicted short-subunit dehydrogenase-like oxidoreductase (DUF2520 family)
MIDEEQHPQDEDPEQLIRSLEIEVFGVFMARALSMVRKEDRSDSIADACRLVDAALKAARGDGSTPGSTTAVDNGLKELIEELHTGYEKLGAAQAAGKTTVEGER